MTADEVSKLLNVSRETFSQFEAYLALLEKWQRRINLVANSTMVDVWQRHILDSAQLIKFYPPNTKKILDVGSGAGFPGLVLAIMGNVEVDLVESDQRKAIFLSTVIRSLGLPAKVHNQRIETLPNLAPDVITARALAPVSKLMKLIEKPLFTKKLIIVNRNEGELLLIIKNRLVLSEYIPSLFCIRAFPRA